MLKASWQKNDTKAKILIGLFSLLVFIVISVLSRVKINTNLGFDVHIFAKANAIMNAGVSLLLVAGLWAVKKKNYLLHKKIMMAALLISVLFLVSYICHHLFAGDTLYGDYDHSGIVTDMEKQQAGTLRTIYLAILITHIPLAGLILPVVLFTAYRALTGEWGKHKKLARYTWPIWLYVAITGVIVYILISPFY